MEIRKELGWEFVRNSEETPNFGRNLERIRKESGMNSDRIRKKLWNLDRMRREFGSNLKSNPIIFMEFGINWEIGNRKELAKEPLNSERI